MAVSFDSDWIEAGAERARALVDEAGARGAALVEAWVTRKNAAAVAEIAGDDDAPAPARKAARRGVQVLRSRGVAVPERTRVARIGADTFETYEAWFRAPQGAGTSAVTLGARTRTGRFRLVDVIVRSGEGIISVANMEMSRTQLRETFAEVEKRFGAAPVAVPVPWARAKIASARAENDRARTIVPLGFETHRDWLGPAPAVSPSHPADAAGLPVPPAAQALARSAKLHAEPELRDWLPGPSAMQSMLIAIMRKPERPAGDETREGEERKEGEAGKEGEEEARANAQTEEMVKEAIIRETDRYFTEAMRRGYAERMRDAAIPMIARGARERAAELLAAAAKVQSLGADEPAHTVPFLRAFFEKAVGLLAARLAARAGQPGP